jgi:hypothetical protein
MTEFEVTEDHLKLVKRMFWSWDDSGYEGAPAVGLKRPYGNSDVVSDIVEILGMPTVVDRWGEQNFTDDVADEAMRIHREMDTVLQIATATLSFEPGAYRKRDRYNSLSWERVDG